MTQGNQEIIFWANLKPLGQRAMQTLAYAMQGKSFLKLAHLHPGIQSLSGLA